MAAVFNAAGHPRRQPIQLVDNDHVDHSTLNVGEQLLECGANETRSGLAPIVIMLGLLSPASVALAHDVRGAYRSLALQRVELNFEALFDAFTGVDCAAHLTLRRSWLNCGHMSAPDTHRNNG